MVTVPPKEPPHHDHDRTGDDCDSPDAGSSGRAMRPLKRLTSIDEARAALLRRALPVERTESLALPDAVGRVAAQDIVAPHDVPPFARSAMDGYAVIADDTFGATALQPRMVTSVGVIHAGEHSAIRLSSGQAMEIATGAPVPDGANAVVMVEETTRSDDGVRIHKPVYPGQNVAQAGEDIKRGSIVVTTGRLLTPARLGAIAALGIPEMHVYARPKIAIVPTGNEVRRAGESLGPGQIHDVNSSTIATVVLLHGGEPVINDVLPDSAEVIEAALRRLATGHEAVIFTGGSSVGTRDMMVDVLTKVGEMDFHGILVKPGKPTLAGAVGKCLVMGMPGNPTSCLTNAYGMLLAPLHQMARLPPFTPRTVRVPMAQRVRSIIGLHHFLPVKIADGKAVAVFKSSGAITSMAEADGYVEISAAVDLVDAGDPVEVILF